MAKLSTSARNKMPAAQFGLPAQRKFPMGDASHAANAKARATQAVNKGAMAPATAAKIDAKANKVLGKGTGAAKKLASY